jgi:hypothetical protein
MVLHYLGQPYLILHVRLQKKAGILVLAKNVEEKVRWKKQKEGMSEREDGMPF